VLPRSVQRHLHGVAVRHERTLGGAKDFEHGLGAVAVSQWWGPCSNRVQERLALKPEGLVGDVLQPAPAPIHGQWLAILPREVLVEQYHFLGDIVERRHFLGTDNN